MNYRDELVRLQEEDRKLETESKQPADALDAPHSKTTTIAKPFKENASGSNRKWSFWLAVRRKVRRR
jgi:hypothetical protein